MAWSIFSNGGGDGSAVTWAKNFLSALGAPDTPADEQFVYDWEKSEGGGGAYNPLNQGPVPGQPQLTTTGSQYGGGAADYASYAAGIQGAVDYLNMSNYSVVKSDLMAGNAAGAKQALIASPWAASHYGNGSAFSNEALPGYSSSLIGNSAGVVDSNANAQASGFSVPGILEGLLGIGGGLVPGTLGGLTAQIKSIAVRLGLITIGGIILVIGLIKLFEVEQKAAKAVGGVAGTVVGATPEGAAAKSVSSEVQSQAEPKSEGSGLSHRKPEKQLSESDQKLKAHFEDKISQLGVE